MSNIKKLLTLEQLADFCKKNKFYSFDSKDSGYKLAVQVPGHLSFSEDPGDLLYTKVKVCHTLLNRNGSFISEDSMKKAMPTLKYKPLLASIVEIDDDGTLDFNGHDMNMFEDEDGNMSIEYIEKQVGTFTADEPYLEYDKDQDKTYVIANAVIPREYTEAANIIERKNGTKVSCELVIDKMSYNSKEKYLELEDFYFSGCACLGEHVGEGMLGSRLDIQDFSIDNNSMKFNIDQKLIEVLDKLDTTLSNFNIDTTRKEETEMENEEIFEEVTDEVTEEITEDSTEEVTVVEENEITEEDAPEVVSENSVETEETEVPEETVSEQVYEKFVKTFEISHEDIRYGLYSLLGSYEELDNEWYWITNVYDSHFVYENWEGTKIFGQSYSKDGDNISFDGDRWELYKELLTASEKAEIENMRANYASIQSELAKYQANEETNKKKELMSSDEYATIFENNEFIELKNSVEAETDNLTFEELKKKADDIQLNAAKSFSLNAKASTEKVGRASLPIREQIESRYGDLFSNKNK